MRRDRFPLIAQEGLPPLLLMLAMAGLLLRLELWWWALLPLAACVPLYLLFRDPPRRVPPVALGIVSPVDGVVESIEESRRCVVNGEARRIRIRVDWHGAYTVRSPIEGLVMDLNARREVLGPDCPTNALWVQNDEGHSVVLQLQNHRFGLAARALLRFGERVGQGQRCALVRLARTADVYLPSASKVSVEAGQAVRAGSDLLGYVPHS